MCKINIVCFLGRAFCIKYNEEYFKLKLKLQKLFLVANILYELSNLKLGTLLRQFSSEGVGTAFENRKMGTYVNNKWDALCGAFDHDLSIIADKTRHPV